AARGRGIGQQPRRRRAEHNCLAREQPEHAAPVPRFGEQPPPPRAKQGPHPPAGAPAGEPPGQAARREPHRGRHHRPPRPPASAPNRQPTAKVIPATTIALRRPSTSDIRPALAPATIAPSKNPAVAQPNHACPPRSRPTLGMIVAATRVSAALSQIPSASSTSRGRRPSPARSAQPPAGRRSLFNARRRPAGG